MRIFLDLDGTLCDFVGGAANLCGVPTGTTPEDRANPHQQPFDMDKKLGVKGVWDKIHNAGAEFWEGLPLLPWASDLFKYASIKGSVTILTNQGDSHIGPYACAGKIRWCKKNLGIESKDVIFCREKWLLAAPDRVLVDDQNDHCVQWEEHGGVDIMIPQPWNMLWHQTHISVMSLVKEQL